MTRAINDGRALDEFRARGYEIVTVPSPFSDATLYSADRLLDDRGMTDFELSLMQSGNLRHLLPDAQRALFTSALRSQVVSSLDRTVDLARERQDQPKLVLTHLMAPHDPILFGVDGSPRQGWPCFPSDCSLFDGGQRYGDAIVEPTVAQVGHLNTLVVDTARRILAESGEPPVIIVFSDHGLRHRLDDHDEMFRSLLLTYTPGQPGIVPPDATPVYLLARILNAYHGSSLVLATEESYFVDIASVRIDGILGLERVAPRAP